MSKTNSHVTVLPRVELEKKNARNLKHILQRTNAVISFHETGPSKRICPCCGEYVGSEAAWKAIKRDAVDKAAPYKAYKELLKEILSKREHVERPTSVEVPRVPRRQSKASEKTRKRGQFELR